MENEVFDNYPQVSTTSLDKAGGNPVVNRGEYNSSRTRVQKRSLLASLTATIPILTILIIWSICAASRGSREQARGLTRRKLSDRAERIEEDEQAILEGCLALEDELGITYPEQANSSHSDRTRRIAELVAMFSETAAAHDSIQSMQQMQHALGLPITSASLPAHMPANSHEQIREPQGFTETAPYYGGNWQAAAWYDTSGSSAYGDGLSALDPNAWLGQTTEFPNVQGGWGQGQPSWATGGELGGGFWKTSVSTAPPSRTGVPRWIEDSYTHPYVRLPVVQHGVRARYFRPERLFKGPLKYMSIHLPLERVRGLLLRETLNQGAVDALVSVSEQLARASWIHARTKLRVTDASLALEPLGFHFLAFDALVCAIQLLGDRMQQSAWWGKFVEAFDISYTFNVPEDSRRHKPKLTAQFANRLLAALHIYKEGGRPPLEEVIALKRFLFSTAYAPSEFRDPRWDDWREDDELHARHGYMPG